MPAYHIEKSTRINAPLAKVRSSIEDFAEWPKWSPWLCMEPDAKLTYTGTAGEVGHGYDWEGELVGAGGMRLAETSDRSLKMDLNFLKPFKSQAKVRFEIAPAGDQETDVTWHMDGKMPFFLFFMIGMMKTMIGMDYNRGLKMLKEYVETGDVLSSTTIEGIVDVAAEQYVGESDTCTMETISDSMNQTMPAVIKASEAACPSGPPGALYKKIDLKKSHCEYTAFVPVTQPENTPNTVTAGEIKPCKAIKVVHTGAYRHLGNAWSAAHSYLRYKKHKPSKVQICFERYLSDPADTSEAELVTEIYIPVKG